MGFLIGGSSSLLSWTIPRNSNGKFRIISGYTVGKLNLLLRSNCGVSIGCGGGAGFMRSFLFASNFVLSALALDSKSC